MMQRPTGTHTLGRPGAKDPLTVPGARNLTPRASELREGLIPGLLGRRRRGMISAARSKPYDVAAPGTPTPQVPPAAERLPAAVTPLIAECLTVALVAKASADLQRTHERSELSKTDIVNRAISFYEFVDLEQSIGSDVILRRANGEEHIVRLL